MKLACGLGVKLAWLHRRLVEPDVHVRDVANHARWHSHDEGAGVVVSAADVEAPTPAAVAATVLVIHVQHARLHRHHEKKYSPC